MQKFNSRYRCIHRWQAHDGIVLASDLAYLGRRLLYITGGNDNSVAVWECQRPEAEPVADSVISNGR